MAPKSFVFRFADIEVREREFALVRAGETLAVEPKAFRVLLILLRNPGKLIPKQELLDAVWGDAAVTENSLARAVGLLRKLLGDEAHSPRFIETVATVGYRFLASVKAVEDPAVVPVAPDLLGHAEHQITHDSPAELLRTKERQGRRSARTGLLAAGSIIAVLLATGI